MTRRHDERKQPMVDDPFAPPAPDDHRQKTPDCKHRETEAERQDNRDRGVFGAADCPRDHVCNLYVGHAAERHRSRKCGHWFGIADDSPSVKAQVSFDETRERRAAFYGGRDEDGL